MVTLKVAFDTSLPVKMTKSRREASFRKLFTMTNPTVYLFVNFYFKFSIIYMFIYHKKSNNYSQQEIE
ncbi:unnamed protein product [Rotaria magnacalcarata]|uniref:Uncharacterized protein n=1 Tax=Rotaria magnacalcarata TaxID=392030 RepID=A0A816PBU1_9BILA|nr:unnamed protein product [Rotaria magnacalcarata]